MEWFEVIQQFFGFTHFPVKHPAFNTIFGEIDDREAVFFQWIQSSFKFKTARGVGRCASPRRWPGFRTGADRAGKNGYNRVAPEIELAVAQDFALAKRMQVAAQK